MKYCTNQNNIQLAFTNELKQYLEMYIQKLIIVILVIILTTT